MAVVRRTPTLRPAPAAPVSARPPRGAPAGLHGAVVVGGLTLAVPIEAIREVVPRPAALLPFPAVRDEVIGAIDLRGAIVPVLDPVALLGVPSPERCPVILILRDANRVIGLAIESIAGVLPLDAADMTQLDLRDETDTFGQPGGARASRAALIRAAFVHGDTRGLVLDIAALAALEAMPLAIERSTATIRPGSVTTGVPTLLFTVGAARLGLAARVIEASVPEQTIAPSPVEDDLWVGWLTHNGRRVPVVDTLRLLRLGECRRTQRTAAVILRLPSGHLVGLQIDAVNDMLRIASDEIKPLQQFVVGNRSLFNGLYGTDAPSLLLDPDAMQADAQLGTVGRICDKTEAGTGSRAAADVERERTNALRAFLLVRLADRRFAIPLSQVEEIIATRTSGLGLTDRTQGIDDYIIHRGRGVPLIDLHRVLGIADSGNGAPFTVLASADGNQAGFMVDELCAVERSSVQLLSDTGGDRAMARIAATITTRGATYPIIDLRAAIETLCPPPPPPPPTDDVRDDQSLAFEKPLQTSS